MWIADVYKGSPTVVSLIFAVVPKICQEWQTTDKYLMVVSARYRERSVVNQSRASERLASVVVRTAVAS